MKIIKINSPKYDIKRVKVDNEDYEWLSKIRWCVNKDKDLFYVVSAKGHLRIHRVIMKLGSWKKDKRIIDHIDHDPLNNQKSNLRIATNTQNNHNIKKLRLNKATSKYKGISFNNKEQLWKSSIVINGKFKHLGYFDLEKDAAIAYNRAAVENFGEFACINKIKNWKSILIKRRGKNNE